jgi:hypothetical protein
MKIAMMDEEPSEPNGLRLAKWLINCSLNGVGPLSSSKDLAQEYLIDKSYASNSDRISSLIHWETSKNFTSGFITGLGGLITLPAGVPAAIGASWMIQARMVGAIAEICDHSTDEDRVRTLMLLALCGDAVKEVLKQAGIKVGRKLTEKVIQQISGKVLIEINKKVGFRLLTKVGEKGVVNLVKIVPVAGGLVGGAFDAYTCRLVGKVARELFESKG